MGLQVAAARVYARGVASAVPICVRLSTELTEKLDARAAEAGVDRSTYLRGLVVRDLDGDTPPEADDDRS